MTPLKKRGSNIKLKFMRLDDLIYFPYKAKNIQFFIYYKVSIQKKKQKHSIIPT